MAFSALAPTVSDAHRLAAGRAAAAPDWFAEARSRLAAIGAAVAAQEAAVAAGRLDAGLAAVRLDRLLLGLDAASAWCGPGAAN